MKKLQAALAVAFFLPACLFGQINNSSGAGGVQNPNSGGGGGGANLPHSQTVISGDGTGNGIATPEKPITVTGSNAFVASDEDIANGRFDCRNPAYAGGCLGSTPGAAMQAFRDRLICYQAITGKHARTILPPGNAIPVGTDAFPTLTLPVGVAYEGVGGWGFATMATQFQATYNNHIAIDFENNLTSSTNCADGSVHTSGLAGGSYDGISEHGCGQGGCHNVPGDSGNYPFGGPGQQGILINDADGTIGAKAGVYANNNGADGVLCNGTDSHCHELGGADNNEYFYFGTETAGQNYQFSAGECHGDVVVGGLDNMNHGPIEVYGTFMTPGWEYGHVAGVCWSGGLTNIGHVFSQIEEIGIIHTAGGNTQASADSVRIDAARGEGILEQSNGVTTWNNPRVISACRFAGAADYLVNSVTTTTPGSGQTPGTYTVTGGDGTTQISVVVGGGGTVTANPTVRVHGRGMTNTPPTYTLSAGGTPATFTAHMLDVFSLLHQASGPSFSACDYITDQSGGNNTYLSPLMVNNGFFGADHSTGDVVTPSTPNTWVAASGNTSNKDIIWDPNPTALGGFWPGGAQRIIRADPSQPSSGFAVTGSVIDVGTDGAHIKMGNGSPVTLTAITTATIAEDLWITGDGFTTMPFSNNLAFFGAVTNTQHDLLLNANQIYHFVVTGGMASGNPVHLTEQSDSIFTDYLQPGFHTLVANSALPATTTQATLDVAGSIAVRSYPPMANPTITIAGSGSAFTYCIVDEVWAGGGKQISQPVCNSHTPPVSTGPSDNFQVHQVLPQNWTRYQVRLNSTTDPGFTPGVWFDTTTPNGLPQLAQCDFAIVFGCVTGGNGLFIEKKVPSDTSLVIPANYGLNITGTYNFDATNLPAFSTNPAIKGQFQIDPFQGVVWYATDEDTWKSWPLSANAADAEVPAGVIDGTNVTFTLINTPTPASSLRLYRNGLRKVSPDDYTITGNTITYQNPPSPGDSHVADYRF